MRRSSKCILTTALWSVGIPLCSAISLMRLCSILNSGSPKPFISRTQVHEASVSSWNNSFRIIIASGGLVDENLTPVVKTASSRRLPFEIIVYLITIGVSFVYIQLCVFLFAIILVPVFLPNRIMHRITFGT